MTKILAALVALTVASAVAAPCLAFDGQTFSQQRAYTSK